MKIITVIGARPQFIKASAFSREVAGREGVEEVLVHTGQHYDTNMSDVFFEELEIPAPKHHLGIGGGRPRPADRTDARSAGSGWSRRRRGAPGLPPESVPHWTSKAPSPPFTAETMPRSGFLRHWADRRSSAEGLTTLLSHGSLLDGYFSENVKHID